MKATSLALRILPILGLAALSAGCAASRSACRCPAPQATGTLGPVVTARDVEVPETVPAPTEAEALPTHALFDAEGGALTPEAATAAAMQADLVAFGELHGHPLGAEWELRLLRALHASGRPVALAMEFFERDVQPAVDAYLAGTLDADAFRGSTRQSKAYDRTHGPLVEFCKEHGLPVIAANAPRPLVSAYRKQEASYEAWLETLTAEQRATLPRSTSTPDDAYSQKFLKFMGLKRGPAFFRSQALWDDAMGEAVADFREAHPDTVVLLIVGGFHVTGKLGTITKFAQRRPDDRVHVMVMTQAKEGLSFGAATQGAGDAVLLLRRPASPKP